MLGLLPSELPVLARARHHWIVMFRLPHRALAVALTVLLLAAVFQPSPMAWVFALVLSALAFLRWQTWRAEVVLLTRSRIIRVRGVPETTTTESSLRLDRISGAVLEQTVWGKLLNYGSIEIEAPGQHPDVRQLVKVARPHQFYLQVRKVVFGEGIELDPDDRPQDFVTAPLPRLPAPPRRRLPRL
ncbi:MAG: PH domain-containing protein [Jatrophihabitantaceae bacterium]